jgi:nicotinamidase-related amidase
MPAANAAPGKLLLSSSDHTLILIDFQSQMAFATKSIDAVTLRNNAALVANAARVFNVSVIPTTGDLVKNWGIEISPGMNLLLQSAKPLAKHGWSRPWHDIACGSQDLADLTPTRRCASAGLQ